ncbi:MAG: hypothetical protein WCQ99_13730 [Pseudomonadota bacterium]
MNRTDITIWNVTQSEHDFCFDIIERFQLSDDVLLETFLKIVAPAVRISAAVKNQSREDKLLLLEGMAFDIHEMRPFLIKNYRPEKSIISLGTRVYAAWDWCLYDHYGYLFTGDTYREVWESLRKTNINYPLRINYCGLLINSLFPWITTDTIQENGGYSPIDINVAIVTAIHEKLFSFYEQVDINAILNKLTRPGKSEPQPLSATFIAATCQLIADDYVSTEPLAVIASKPQQISKVRSQRFFNMLSNKLQCEVTQGKGSEVTIYRAGGKKIRIGHHKRNTHIHSTVMKSILSRLNITGEEWLSAVA